VVESTDARPLLSPNDLILDTKGGIYFTDPGPRPVVPDRPTAVLYLPAGAKQPIVVDDKVARPNGLILTLDGKTLIVADTIGVSLFAYVVQPDGTLKHKRTFATVRDIAPGQESGADGIALDRDGRLYVTTATGVQVFDARSVYLGTIKVPKQPSNVAFAGPDKRTLYITAREGVYKLAMLAQGPDRPGK
jgi:gluconolactonase